MWALSFMAAAALALAGALPAAAQDGRAAPVQVGGRDLFVIEGGLRNIDATERAHLVNRRIERILRDPDANPRSIEAQLLPDGDWAVVHDGEPIVRVSEADARRARLSARKLAEQWARSLRATATQLQPLYAQERGGVSVRSLTEHHVLILLVQLAALLLVARLCGEVALRCGQPPVIGQLLAGVLLGPSVLGALLPRVRAFLFPVEATQSSLMEVLSWLGVLFLLLLTGMETDAALLRRHRRPVTLIALTGIVLPFGLGVALGHALPETMLTTPESRLVLSLFLGTALSISSVPVIARILQEMGLLQQRVGQLILASALADDTVGWVILSMVARFAARGTIEPVEAGRAVLGTAAFLLFCALLGGRLVNGFLALVKERCRGDYCLTTACIVLMLAGAAVTQFLGVHALLGAFVVGILLRRSPDVTEEALQPVAALTSAVFAPVFFASAGLKVNLVLLDNPAILWVGFLLVASAAVGKIAGGYLGARFGRLPHWDALSIGFGVNARGAMGLIVGVLGFSLGILTVEMFSLIILMVVLTTALTPPLLRWSTARGERMKDEG